MLNLVVAKEPIELSSRFLGDDAPWSKSWLAIRPIRQLDNQRLARHSIIILSQSNMSRLFCLWGDYNKNTSAQFSRGVQVIIFLKIAFA